MVATKAVAAMLPGRWAVWGVAWSAWRGGAVALRGLPRGRANTSNEPSNEPVALPLRSAADGPSVAAPGPRQGLATMLITSPPSDTRSLAYTSPTPM